MQDIFRRREKKYLITSEQRAALQSLIAMHMAIDQLGEYLIRDLYYDTDNWDIICKSIERPSYNMKGFLTIFSPNIPKASGWKK